MSELMAVIERIADAGGGVKEKNGENEEEGLQIDETELEEQVNDLGKQITMFLYLHFFLYVYENYHLI